MTTAKVFRDTSRRGVSASLSLAADQRYDVKRFLDDLAPSGLAHAISSVELSHGGSDGGAESSLYLFAGNSQVQSADYRRSIPYSVLNMRTRMPYIQDFHGAFLRLTLPSGSTPFIVDDLRAHSFNDKTTSL